MSVGLLPVQTLIRLAPRLRTWDRGGQGGTGGAREEEPRLAVVVVGGGERLVQCLEGRGHAQVRREWCMLHSHCSVTM